MTQILRGITWDHPRGFESLVNSNKMLEESLGVTVRWEARSLLEFGDQHISEFYEKNDLMVIDHPHVPDAVHAGAVIAFDEMLSAPELFQLKRTSVGESHASYNYRGKQWALANDAAAQVSAFRPDKTESAPIFWSDVLSIAKTGTLLWPYKPVDAFSTFATLMAQKGMSLNTGGIFVYKKIANEVLGLMIELAAMVPDFCSDSNPIDIFERLSSGDKYSTAVCLYGYSNYARKGFRKNQLKYDDVPSFDGRATGSQLGGAGIAISSKSINPELSAQVAFLIASPAIQSTTYVEGGGQPGNLLAWKNASANEITCDFFINTLRTLERAWVRPRLLGWPEIQFAASQIIHKILLNRSFSNSDIDELDFCYEKFVRE